MVDFLNRISIDLSSIVTTTVTEDIELPEPVLVLSITRFLYIPWREKKLIEDELFIQM